MKPELIMVVCNEGHRLGPLLEHMRPSFDRINIVVQESDDDTYQIARAFADAVAIDQRRGFGDASMKIAQNMVKGDWAIRIDADEWPIPPLLESLGTAVAYCNERRLDGLWIPFRSWIERIEWKQDHSHLRLWRNRVRWPPTLHSRPNTTQTEVWPIGYIYHWKTLDEHVRGYLGYLKVSGDNRGWIDHNKMMIEVSCRGAAEVYGWEFVEGHEWWPKVRREVFNGKDHRQQTEMAVAEP